MAAPALGESTPGSARRLSLLHISPSILSGAWSVLANCPNGSRHSPPPTWHRHRRGTAGWSASYAAAAQAPARSMAHSLLIESYAPTPRLKVVGSASVFVENATRVERQGRVTSSSGGGSWGRADKIVVLRCDDNVSFSCHPARHRAGEERGGAGEMGEGREHVRGRERALRCASLRMCASYRWRIRSPDFSVCAPGEALCATARLSS